MEEELAKHLKQLADQFHGLAPVKCRELAFEYAEKNNWTEKQCEAGEQCPTWLRTARQRKSRGVVLDGRYYPEDPHRKLLPSQVALIASHRKSPAEPLMPPASQAKLVELPL
ncbi:unnamed protein product [Pleuronectes platessa]|uniref:Uncharacterized protein n=1 Tax=Pleuronectes platessa TaxID=8262 RepID=A0A9N7YPC1_PLEPL|nr:unnamed protein product [Pleuronectes platessa]